MLVRVRLARERARLSGAGTYTLADHDRLWSAIHRAREDLELYRATLADLRRRLPPRAEPLSRTVTHSHATTRHRHRRGGVTWNGSGVGTERRPTSNGS